MLLYAITQRSLFAGDEAVRAEALRAQAIALAAGGIHYLQIREKDLPVSVLGSLAASIVREVRSRDSPMKILLNGPADIAVQAGCDGVHLTGDAPGGHACAARRMFSQAGRPCIISAACHSIPEIRNRAGYSNLLLFAPVFQKLTPQRTIPGAGLSALSQAVQAAQGTPVLALGGVNLNNANACVRAGAAGIAAIRLFLGEGWMTLPQT